MDLHTFDSHMLIRTNTRCYLYTRVYILVGYLCNPRDKNKLLVRLLVDIGYLVRKVMENRRSHFWLVDQIIICIFLFKVRN